MRVLAFSSNFDLATFYGAAWIMEIADIARSLGHEVMEIIGANATDQAFYDAMNTFTPDMIFAMGHGGPDEFTGQNKMLVLKACENDEIMSGAQAYFVSCLLGQDLSPSMVSKKARTVAAYIGEFLWMINPDYASDPLNDPYAYPFRRAVVEPSRILLSDGGWRDWYNRTIQLYNEGVNQWWNSSDPTAGQIVAGLKHDRDSLTVLGEFTGGPTASRLALLVPLGGLVALLALMPRRKVL